MPHSLPEPLPSVEDVAAPSASGDHTPHYHRLSDEALEAYLVALDTERVEADPWLLPAVDRRRIAALGDAFHRPYHALDQADLPEETEQERVTPAILHTALCVALHTALQVRYHGRRDVLATMEMGLYYDSVAGSRPGRAAPDLTVAFGASSQGRRSYLFWREQKSPAFALEVLSPSTWRRDVGVKRAIYANLGIRDYFVFDPDDHIAPRLQGFGLHDGTYRPLPAERLPGGMVGVHSAALGLHLCHEEPWPDSGWRSPNEAGRLCWYDPAAGRYLETAPETARRADEESVRADRERARAEQERARADAAQARVLALEARLRQLGGER